MMRLALALVFVLWILVGCSERASVTNWQIADLGTLAAVVTPEEHPPVAGAVGKVQQAPKHQASQPPLPARIVRGNPKEKFIALTFDDGPHEGFTEALIRTLVADDVKATMFFIGRNVEKAPHLAKLAADQGFEIGNHSMNHLRMWELGDSEIRHEIVKGQAAIERATGIRPRWFRPPGGVANPTVERVLRERGLSLALWSADAGDFTRPWGNPSAQEIYARAVREAKPGSVMIMHDPMPTTLQAIPLIVASLRAQGFRFLTLSELASRPGVVTEGAPKIAEGTAFLARNAQDRARYPFDQAQEAWYENSKQRTPQPAAKKGEARQRADQSRDR